MSWIKCTCEQCGASFVVTKQAFEPARATALTGKWCTRCQIKALRMKKPVSRHRCWRCNKPLPPDRRSRCRECDEALAAGHWSGTSPAEEYRLCL